MIEGFLLVNKPRDKTSFWCIRYIKRLVGKRVKIGHAGTLDPFATGLLIVGIGRNATKHLGTFLTLDKIYIARAKLGLQTDTLDITGSIIKQNDTINITKQELQKAIEQLGNSYQQIPPIFSALKYNGKRLCVLAREKKKSVQELNNIVRQKVRDVTLYSVELQEYSGPYFQICAHVSHGTYIRSLIDDIAQKAGGYATTVSLCRTDIGSYCLSRAIDLETLQTLKMIEKNCIPVDQFLQQLNRK